MNRLTISALAALVLAGCGKLEEERAASVGAVVVGRTETDWAVYRVSGPDEFGVVCYKTGGTSVLSCVQTAAPKAGDNPR